MNTGVQVLVVDDEMQIRRFLRISLEANGYQVYEAANGQDALLKAVQIKPDLVILDLGLPDLDGVAVLKRLREWSSVSVIILSARDQESDKIAALDAGADDYLTKPFSTGELMARMRTAQRHNRPAPDATTFTCGDLHVDLSRRSVTVRNGAVKLTPTEYALLRMLIQHAGKVLRTAQTQHAGQ